MMLAQMVSLAATMHEGQQDKGGMPYVFHVVEVARRVMEKYGDAVTTAHHKSAMRSLIVKLINELE